MSLFSLEGRIALVTGAGRGIGRGIAEGFGEHGAKVVCAARTRSQLDEAVAAIEGKGSEALAVEMDVSDLDSIHAGVQAAVDRFGQIDILVNNAGTNVRESMMDVTEEHYDQIMAVNLKGLYFLSQAVVKQMIPRKQGKIINIGSLTTGISLDQVSVYTATKGAVGQLTKAQALELGQHNIQVNAICPGFVVTPLTEKVWANPTMREWGEKGIPSGRLATPEDLVGTAVFLAAPASDYVSGQSIYVDGGFMAGDYWPLPASGGNK
ncbi:MAG: glucose 1-dehydrogenase [bacterium]|nr:glucose 1-dehydrogenase [bacterium]